MKHYMMLLSMCLVMSLMFLPASWAESSGPPDPAVVNDVANHVSLFEQLAAQVSNDAGQLWTLTRSHQTAWGNHACYLNNLREDINEMGGLLAELEAMKPQASEAQQIGIERMRPHLVALAEKTSEALNLARNGNSNLRHTPYKDALSGLYEQADVLYQTVDAIGDYHDANDRFQKLESSHGGSVS